MNKSLYKILLKLQILQKENILGHPKKIEKENIKNTELNPAKKKQQRFRQK